MSSPPRPRHRLFSRRLVLLNSSPRVANRPARVLVEISVREFLALGHFVAHGEPVSFELSLSNVFREPWEIHGPATY
jgi:hypothetical protein